MQNLPTLKKVGKLNNVVIYLRTNPDGHQVHVLKTGRQFVKHFDKRAGKMTITTFKTQYEAETAAINYK